MRVPHIHLITTGGTIGESAADSGSRRHLSGDALLGAAGQNDETVRVSTRDLYDVQSPAIRFEEMLGVARAVDHAIEDGAEAVVVTHGTSTLEETAYFVELVINDRMAPVVFTGAMRSSAGPGQDGPQNLLDAIRVARAPEARARGVLVCMAGEIHAASEVTKFHTSSVSAFRSPEFGPIGTVEFGRVLFTRATAPGSRLPVTRIAARVEGLKCYADMNEAALQGLVSAGVGGIVLETFGAGQVPPTLMPVVREAIDAGVTIVATSRCPTGRLALRRSGLVVAPGDEGDLLDAGVLFSDLQGPKARIKLILALSAGFDRAGLERAFARE